MEKINFVSLLILVHRHFQKWNKPAMDLYILITNKIILLMELPERIWKETVEMGMDCVDDLFGVRVTSTDTVSLCVCLLVLGILG